MQKWVNLSTFGKILALGYKSCLTDADARGEGGRVTTIHKDGLSTFLTTESNPKFNLKQNTSPTISNPKPK